MNTTAALLYQMTALVCGFVLPRYILGCFGSELNGLTSSFASFLNAIAFLELGIGPVIQSSLYKPLAHQDMDTVSKIVISAERFYRRIAYIFLGYIGLLVLVMPRLVPNFEFAFSASLLIIISISTFAQYFWGITYQMLLNADQRSYVYSSVQIVTCILNTVFCILMMKLGFGIHMVKLCSAFIYVLRPIAQNLYVRKYYAIRRDITYTEEPIQQKWNGFAQHLASVVCGEIDVVLLSLFRSYQSVSIYTTYMLVINGLTQVVMTGVRGLGAYWGNMLARKEFKLLYKTFESVECLIHAGVTVLFVAASILISPFIQVYTRGMPDSADYYMQLFGVLLAAAYGARCLRIPYFQMIQAAGHYKQTQNGAFFSMGLNIVLSVILVFPLGLEGVALGTLAAMLYHTVYFVFYLRNNIIDRPVGHFFRHLAVDGAAALLSAGLTGGLSMGAGSYTAWVIYAVQVTVLVGLVTAALNLAVYRKEFAFVAAKLLRRK